MAEGGDPDPNTFLDFSSGVQGIENASNYAIRREKELQELATKAKSLNSNYENASKEAITHKGDELCNLQIELDHLKEENKKNKKDFRLKVKNSRAEAAQKCSSAKLQSRSGKKQEIKSPSHISPLEQLLKARKVSVDNRELLIAAGQGDPGKVENLIQQGSVDIDFADRVGNTALHYAVESSNLKIINLLIENNAKIDLENEHNETSFDVAVRWKNKEIITEFEKKVVSRSIELLKNTKGAAESTTISLQKNCKVAEDIKNTELEKEIEDTKQKINCLLELLKQIEEEGEKHVELDYKKAMIFILFIETFAFQGSGKKFIRDNLREFFLKNRDEKKEIKKVDDYRRLFLKSKEKIYTFNDINKAIKIDDFLNNLKQHLSRYMEYKEKIEIELLLSKLPSDIKSNVGAKSDSDPYGKLIDLVSEVCKKDVDLYKQWFEFIFNIHPKLGEEKVSSDLREAIDYLRNNLIHSFYNYGIFEFKKAVIHLRGKLVEYSYAKQVCKYILNSIIDNDPAEIEKGLEEQLQEVKKKFVATEELSSEEADELFGYRVVKCLYPPLAEKTSQEEELLKVLVIDYWRYVLPVDLVCERHFNRKFGGVERRMLFEKFIALKRTKQTFPDYYRRAKKKLKIMVNKYGCRTSSFEKICKKYVENDKKLDEKTNEIVDNIVKFINITQSVKDILGYREDSIISFTRDILKVQDENVKKLVLTQSKSISRMKGELERKTDSNEKIRQLMDLASNLRKVFIEKKEGSIKIVDKMEENKKVKKVTEAVINIVETLYNAYNEYNVDFNLKKIFSTRNFLKELEKEIKDNIPIIIERLIDIDYMLPLVSSLIVKESKKVTNNSNLEKIINRMLDDEEYTDYLKDLLKVEFYDGFKFYEMFYLKVREKDIDIENISTIFKEPKNIQNFITVLVDKFEDSSDDRQEKNKIIKVAKSLLEIINKDIAESYYDKNTSFKPNEGLEAAEKIYDLKNVIGKAYPDFSGFADMSILKAKIKNQERKSQEALTILDNLEKDLKNNASLKTSYLLTLYDIAYTYKLQKKYVDAQTKYNVLYNEIISYSLKLNIGTVARKTKGTYDEVKDLNEYKSLLNYSELLHCKKYLNVLNVLSDIAHMTSKSGEKNSNVEILNKALSIYQDVYRFRKRELGSEHKMAIQVLVYIASTNMKIGNILKKKKHLDAQSYFQRALIKYIIVYDARKKMLDDNHNIVLQTTGMVIRTLGDIALIHNEHAELNLKNNPKEALQHYEKALKIHEEVLEFQVRILGEENDKTKMKRINIAFTHHKLFQLKSLNNPEQALKHHEKLLKIYEDVLEFPITILGEEKKDKMKKHRTDIAYTHNELARLKLSNNPEEALKHYEEALKIFEDVLKFQIRILGKGNEKTMKNMSDIACTHNELSQLKSSNNPEEALKHHERALKMYEDVLEFQIQIFSKGNETENKIDIAFTHDRLAELKSSRNPEEALKHNEKASEIYKEVLAVQIRKLGKSHDETKKIRNHLEFTINRMNKL